MWKQIYRWVAQILLLSRDTRQNRLDIEEMREELSQLTGTVEKLLSDTQRIQEKFDHVQALEASEREKMVLRLENEMLRFERRLLADDRYKGRLDGSSAGGFEAS